MVEDDDGDDNWSTTRWTARIFSNVNDPYPKRSSNEASMMCSYPCFFNEHRKVYVSSEPLAYPSLAELLLLPPPPPGGDRLLVPVVVVVAVVVVAASDFPTTYDDEFPNGVMTTTRRSSYGSIIELSSFSFNASSSNILYRSVFDDVCDDNKGKVESV